MAETKFKGHTIHTCGDLPKVKSQAPAFRLTKADLSSALLENFENKKIILNCFPSLDTSVCAQSVRQFNQKVSEYPDVQVLCISADLPFAHQRFCTTEGLKHVLPLSVFKSPEFGRDYGLVLTDGPLEGLLARAVLVIHKGKVIYTELVPEITQEPNYEAVFNAL